MRKIMFAVLVGLMGCGVGQQSTTTDSSGLTSSDNPSCPMLRYFQLNGYEESGNCGVGAFPDETRVRKQAANYYINFKSVGSDCGAVVDGCSLYASCDYEAAGGVRYHSDYDYTFTESGFHGTETVTVPAFTPKSGPRFEGCETVYRETGTPL